MPTPSDADEAASLPGEPQPTAEGARSRRQGAFDMLALALVALALRLPAFLSSRHLSFDDGVFASSVVAMRDGGVPFREVFSSQGPLFLPLVYLGDLLGGRTLDSPRVLAVASGVAVTLGLYWCARQVGDRSAALLAGALAATSGSLMWVTAPLAADGPALAFAVFAFGVALSLRSRRPWWQLVLLGALVGATLSTKSLEAPILVPVVAVLVAPLLRREGTDTSPAEPRSLPRRVLWRTTGELALSGFSAAVVFVAVTAPFGFAAVWDQSFRYRADAATDREPLANAAKIFSTLWDRDLVLLVFLALAVLWALGGRFSPRLRTATTGGADRAMPSGRFLIMAWAGSTWLWLVFVVSPLWRPHVSAMVPPLVLAVAAWRPPLRAVLVAGVLSMPLLWVQLEGLRQPGDYHGAEAEIVAALEDLPEGAWVLSDEPGLVWRAGRRTTDDMVDPSMLRVRQGRYTEQSLAEAAADRRICAVVVRSPERFGSFPGLADRLASLGYELVHTDGAHGRLYVRETCAADP